MASQWRHLFTENLQYKRRLSIDNGGNPTYYPTIVIKGRTDHEVKEVQNLSGQLVTTSMLILTETPIKAGDVLIIDHVEHVIEISHPAKLLDNIIDHYQVRV